ncbi:HWE histidine kinase domain-containing protein [Devosia sp. RR2S18]|uniref:HWE histidine kinase domain-containing protein n=1 Tax=Devosia rhizosphaerae TaxID=3049774 RepID=UPI0025404C70|nr:HWE histidine kinase domain-containing protein [Devosia sp. RR2S18]WIJ24299.1 GAF domain-containing protein [Devosia sp. RR2S18]
MSATTEVDLTNCDREPIHIPGSIQPHGCLLACDMRAEAVLRHSVNASEMLECSNELNGSRLGDVLGRENAHAIRNALSRTQDPQRASLLFGMTLPSGRNFDVAVHRFKDHSIIELEPSQGTLAEPLDLARSMIGRITNVISVERLVRDTAKLIHAMLGYDRVMVYQFDHDGAGKVLSEAKHSKLESFLGQYFPATDIPQQARALYLQNTIRIISDADCKRIPVVPASDALGQPLDLTFAHLRSVSPVHCEYLRNMGVGASMSISIIVDGALWGLIACHHYSPRTLTMSERVAAEMFGEFFSLQLSVLQQKRTLDMATNARAALDRFLRHATRANSISETLRERLSDFRELIPCDGIGLWLDGQWAAMGDTPPEHAIGGLTALAAEVSEGRIWSTNRLAETAQGAEEYAGMAAGMLIVPLSQRPRDYLFFFRKEVAQTLNWAGNPEKTYTTGPLGDRLTPRKSFAIWKETVHLQSLPWTEDERQFAEAARAALAELVLQQSELLADEREKEEARRRMLNGELNHRVKNILAVIKSLVGRPSEGTESLEHYANALRGRIQALATAHDQIARGDGGDLRDLLNAELAPYRDSGERVQLKGLPVCLAPRAFSVMALVLHELSTNAVKYGALSQSGGALTVRWQMEDGGGCLIHWTESGGPVVTPPEKQGFGTMLIGRSVPHDLGGETQVHYRPDGLEVRFLIPAQFVFRRDAEEIDPVAAPAGDETSATSLAGRSVMIVEDQVLIAMDLEMMLSEAGMSVVTAASVRESLNKVQEHALDAAILDFNLGEESSLQVAEELQRRGVPFAFASGYGDHGALPETMSHVPMVAKPYEPAAILRTLAEVLANHR